MRGAVIFVRNLTTDFSDAGSMLLSIECGPQIVFKMLKYLGWSIQSLLSSHLDRRSAAVFSSLRMCCAINSHFNSFIRFWIALPNWNTISSNWSYTPADEEPFSGSKNKIKLKWENHIISRSDSRFNVVERMSTALGQENGSTVKSGPSNLHRCQWFKLGSLNGTLFSTIVPGLTFPSRYAIQDHSDIEIHSVAVSICFLIGLWNHPNKLVFCVLVALDEILLSSSFLKILAEILPIRMEALCKHKIGLPTWIPCMVELFYSYWCGSIHLEDPL